MCTRYVPQVYCRPAPMVELDLPEILRPIEVLQATVKHLGSTIIELWHDPERVQQSEATMLDWSQFIEDRSRQVTVLRSLPLHSMSSVPYSGGCQWYSILRQCRHAPSRRVSTRAHCVGRPELETFLIDRHRNILHILQVLQDIQIQRLSSPEAVEIVEQVVRMYLLVRCQARSLVRPSVSRRCL